MWPYPYKNVGTGSVGVKKRFGKFTGLVEPGLNYFNPYSQSIDEVSLKTHILELRNQKVFTRDNIAVTIDTVVFFRVFNPEKAVYSINNINQSILEVSYATLRAIAGEFLLNELLEDRMRVSKAFKDYTIREVYNWGIEIDHLLIRDMALNKEIQENLSVTAVTRRKVESKIISAEADIQAAKMMKEAADILNTKAAVQIRYLNSITTTNSEGKRWLLVPLSFEDLSAHL